MASKRLSVDDMQKMKSMVTQGVAPEDIAKHFKIAISSVHNYKNRFKKEGLKFPNVRGMRPTGSIKVPAGSPVKVATAQDSNNNQAVAKLSSQAVTGDVLHFTVNGVSVNIAANAKNVTIGQNGIEVTF